LRAKNPKENERTEGEAKPKKVLEERLRKGNANAGYRKMANIKKCTKGDKAIKYTQILRTTQTT